MTGNHRGAPRAGGVHQRLRRPALALAGLVVLAVAALIWWRAQPAPNVGAATVATLAAATPSPAGTDAVPVHAGALPASTRDVAPVRIRLPEFGVSATIVATGVDASGDFAVPANIDTVGWYEYGPGLAASSGSVVIAGHVDTAAAGDGAFFHLRDLSIGDRFTITGSDGRTRTYRVVARQEYPKATIDLNTYFSTTGRFRITLMTCGGSFNHATGHYRDNIAITAIPAV